jgi:Glycosyl hydrolase family 26
VFKASQLRDSVGSRFGSLRRCTGKGVSVTEFSPELSAERGNYWERPRIRRRFRPAVYVALIIGLAVVIRGGFLIAGALSSPSNPHPTQSVRYLGVYEPDAPGSYTDVNRFAHAIGRQPNLVLYYSHWLKPFNVSFATAAAKNGAVTIVQIAPNNVSLADITSGRYDAYLRSYALSVKAFGAPVILSFGHEMNGSWYSWGNRHTSPRVFVGAWRHIVTLFRAMGADNVTWMWTANIVGPSTPGPKPWWPGSSYVNWVGIDGYYRYPSEEFASVFGAAIVDVREFTSDPILISETAAQPSEDQSAKIADLFAGVHTYGLLGFVWFDADDLSISDPGEVQYWRLTSPTALATFGRDARAWMKPLAHSSGQSHASSGSSSP